MLPRVRDQGSIAEEKASSQAQRLVLLATLLGVLFLGLALRLYRLDASSLWWDEVKTATTSRLDFVSVWHFQATESAHPPLLYLVTGFFMSLFGESDFVIRLQAALFGALAVPLTYKLGAILWTRREGVMGAFLVAINAFLIRYSQEARHYSLMVFLALLSLIFLLKALREHKKENWILFALFTSLSLYTHYFAFLILPSELVFAAWVIVANWRSHRRRAVNCNLPTSTDVTATASLPSPTPTKQALHLAGALALVGLSYVPWLPSLKQQLFGRMVEFGGMGLGELPKADLSLRYFGEVLQAYIGLGGIFLLLWLALFALGLATCKPRHILLFGLWITIPFSFPFVVRSSHFFDVKYAMYVVPILLLIAARGVSVLIGLLTHRLHITGRDETWRFALGSLLAICALAALNVAPVRAYYLSPKADYRGVAEYLAANAHPDDIILADGEGFPYGDSTTVIRNLSYYMDRLGIAEIPVLAVEPGLIEAVAREAPPHGGQVWAVLLSSELASAATDEVVATAPFEELRVVQLHRPSGDVQQDTVLMLDALTRLLREPKAHFDIHLALAEFYAAAGNEEETTAQFELAKSSQPVDRSAHLDLAAFYAGQGRWEDAVEEYLAFFQAPPSLLEGWREREAYWDLGLAYEQLGNLEQALAAYKEVLDLDPTYWQAYRKLGDLYLSLGEPGEALAAYQSAVDLQPQNARLYYFLGRAYHSLDRIEEGTLAYQQALALDPNDEWAKAQLTSFSRLTAEDIPHPLFRSLAADINLLGYDISPATPEAGSSLQVTLWWQALANMDSDYTVFIHVVAPDGGLCAQGDSLLEHDGLPTSDWRIGLLVKDTYQLPLPIEATPGNYTVLVGIYHWETGERLPVWDADGVRAPGDTIALSTLTLER